MTDPTSGWNRLGAALASGPGLGAFALLAAVALAAMILFRPQIARLLDRTVVLRVLGVYLLALPGRPRRDGRDGQGGGDRAGSLRVSAAQAPKRREEAPPPPPPDA